MPIYLTPIGSPSAELLADLRIALGSPTTTEIPDSTLQRFLIRALRWVNEKCPRQNMTYFTTTANVQIYTPTLGHRPIEVWPPNDSGFGTVYFPELGTQEMTDVEGLDVFNSPALLIGFYLKISQYRLVFQEGWDWINDQIYLLQKPTEGGLRCYYLYCYDWTFATINQFIKEMVLAFAQILALEYFRNKQGKGKFTSVSSRGISVSMSPFEIDSEIQRLRDRFDELCAGYILVPIERG